MREFSEETARELLAQELGIYDPRFYAMTDTFKGYSTQVGKLKVQIFPANMRNYTLAMRIVHPNSNELMAFYELETLRLLPYRW